MDREPTLSEVLAEMGIRHERSPIYYGKQQLFAADGRDLGSYAADEAWKAVDDGSLAKLAKPAA